MVNSINTNIGAQTALRTLNNTRQENNITQNRINTGKEVNSAKDNAANLAIAQQLLGEQGGRVAVDNSLNRAQSTLDVASAAGEQVDNLLLRARELTVAARDPGLDDNSRQALNNEFQSIRDQIGSVVDSASFNGTNVIRSGGDDVSALLNEDGSSTLTVGNSDLSLGGANVTLAADADISTLAGANASFEQIETSASNVSNVLSNFGSNSNRLEQAQEFNQTLSDVTEAGIGNLVDANLAEEAANQIAGQVREQLGFSALSIANNQPQNIASLLDG